MDHQITSLLGARFPDSWLPSTQLSASDPQVINFGPTKSEIIITGSNDLKSAIHTFRFIRVESHMPLEIPGVNCGQILIQLFYHLRKQKLATEQALPHKC